MTDFVLDVQDFYSHAFEHAGDCMLVVQHGHIVACNQAAMELFACRREQLIGQSPVAVSPEYQPGGQLSSQLVKEKVGAAMTGAPQFFEWQHLRFDGEIFDAEVILNRFVIGDQQFVIGCVRDITKRKQIEQALSQSTKALQQQHESLKLISDLAEKLHSSLELKSIAEATLSALLGGDETPHLAFYILDKTGRNLELQALGGLQKEIPVGGYVLPIEHSIGEAALKSDTLLVSQDFSKDARINPWVKTNLKQRNMKSGVVIPLCYEGKALGSVSIIYESYRPFSNLEIETLESIRTTVALALSNALVKRELQYQALHDNLTGLPNRQSLHDTFAAKISRDLSGENFPALMLIDLDRFKEVNDTLGHHIGDLLLKEMGPRIHSLFSNIDYELSRLGGDEFTLLFPGISGADQAKELAASVLRVLRMPFFVKGIPLEIDASIGIALYPLHGSDSHSLLRSADVAMYEAKFSGSGLSVYDKSFDKHTPERLAMMAELGQGIREQQLLLHFQPKLDLRTRLVAGFEALVRWQHPVQGLIYPDQFMPLAEVSEVIHALSHEVLELALYEQRVWLKRGYRLPVAVNLSARNLIDDRYFLTLRALLEKYQTQPGMLELEITETALMQDPDRATELLNAIAALGVTLSIDDYGTGYSSLGYIRQLPVHALKIDRVFINHLIDNEADQTIVQSTITLGHNLDLEVIAEGIEDEQTQQQLILMGCDQAQGYHIARPMPAGDVIGWLERFYTR